MQGTVVDNYKVPVLVRLGYYKYTLVYWPMSLYGPNPTPAKRTKRWNQRAYTSPGDSSVWKHGDEGYLIREYKEFNLSPGKDYLKFIKTVAYTLGRSQSQIRSRLKQLHEKGIIEKRKH